MRGRGGGEADYAHHITTGPPDFWTVIMINFQSNKKKEFPNKKKEFSNKKKNFLIKKRIYSIF